MWAHRDLIGRLKIDLLTWIFVPVGHVTVRRADTRDDKPMILSDIESSAGPLCGPPFCSDPWGGRSNVNRNKISGCFLFDCCVVWIIAVCRRGKKGQRTRSGRHENCDWWCGHCSLSCCRDRPFVIGKVLQSERRNRSRNWNFIGSGCVSPVWPLIWVWQMGGRQLLHFSTLFTAPQMDSAVSIYLVSCWSGRLWCRLFRRCPGPPNGIARHDSHVCRVDLPWDLRRPFNVRQSALLLRQSPLLLIDGWMSALLFSTHPNKLVLNEMALTCSTHFDYSLVDLEVGDVIWPPSQFQV